ncbi:MAG: glycerol-3-phosphate 1-O-acyltransferase PlsY [Ignavibacteriales bacterium]|nr:MAG: glycerol-3-phosphate 1-O-acyltransferase PlsY [Ignavibacteriaceae bacterium]MBW7874274.1 glycerol-3-phosphate 1-O-acyltransferase PlsY [Ignavibacteria bacterium]MCZ2142682.1 glycerol-3-phosphate 1-O-acyltransferase PlsY [Ignavibacteriales bacterium]OQY73029.1 MAG: acyl-phosphate glycerol 3-phosphate acyltransferase [Ignavibacteriales bacterium UTCHB3]MBV6443780.1 Glycerol-3-phosphate acyltransferase [Ignavibacteriaceae bacterium]
MLALAAILILSYLIGSIPFGVIVSKRKGIDIKAHGSGNTGGTNVFRTLGPKYGITVTILDALKGVVAVVLVSQLYYIDPVTLNNQTPFQDITIIRIMAGIFAIIGHIWSIFASFKGGKGVATALGMMVSITTVDMLIALGIFIIVVSIFKYVSLGSILAAITVPLTLIIRQNIFHAEVQGYGTLLPFVLGVAVLLVYMHRTNIQRLLKGNENKISFSKKK